MADASDRVEAVGKAFVRERIAAAPAVGSVDALATEIVRKAEEGSWRDALKIASETETPINREAITQNIDNFGVSRGRDGKIVRRPTSPEEQRFTQATNAADLAIRFAETGYDGITIVAEKTTIRETFENVILQNPVLAQEYGALATPAEKQQFIERLLKDPKYASSVRETLSQVAREQLSMDGISSAKEALDQAALEQRVKNSDFADAQRRLTAIQTRLNEFSQTTPAGGVGAKYQELEDLRGRLQANTIELKNFQQQFESEQFRLGQLQQEREATLRTPGVAGRRPLGDIDNEILTARNAMSTFQGEISTRQAEILRIPQLEQEQQALEQQRAVIAQESSEKQLEKGSADIAVDRAQREHQDAIRAKTNQEKAIVAKLQGVFSVAAKEYTNAELVKLMVPADEALKEVNKKVNGEQQKALVDHLEHRWRRMVPRLFGGEKPVINEALTNEDFGILMQQGPEVYMRHVLTGLQNPVTHATYVDADINALIADENFMKDMSPILNAQILARRAMVRGIEPADVYTITHTTWGEKAIAEAIKSNDTFRKTMQDLVGSVDDPNFMDRVKRGIVDHPGWAASIIGAIIATGGVALGAAIPLAVGAGGVGVAGTGIGSAYSGSRRMYG